jgi:hypothetical protein
MRNLGKLGFKNYLDAPDQPSVWNSPKLIVQLDSLLNVLFKNDKFVCEEKFNLQYDMNILDESERLLSHFDEKTMENKEIQIWNFFDQLLKHSERVVLMDGDISRRSLSFASSDGELTYIKNTNTGGKKTINLTLDHDKLERQLYADLKKFHKEDPNFKFCIMRQSSSMAGHLEQKLGQDLTSTSRG